MTAFEEDMNTNERALWEKSASAASIFLADGSGWKRTVRIHGEVRIIALGGHSNRSPGDFADRPALLTKRSMYPKAVNIASPKRGRSPGSARSFLMKERRAPGSHIGCDAFVDLRIDCSVTTTFTMPWPISRLFATKC
jgi:hypothetical protein